MKLEKTKLGSLGEIIFPRNLLLLLTDLYTIQANQKVIEQCWTNYRFSVWALANNPYFHPGFVSVKFSDNASITLPIFLGLYSMKMLPYFLTVKLTSPALYLIKVKHHFMVQYCSAQQFIVQYAYFLRGWYWKGIDQYLKLIIDYIGNISTIFDRNVVYRRKVLQNESLQPTLSTEPCTELQLTKEEPD